MATDCNGNDIKPGDFVCHLYPNSFEGFGGRIEVSEVGTTTVTLKDVNRSRIPVFLAKKCMVVNGP